jgi:hypothetical protein
MGSAVLKTSSETFFKVCDLLRRASERKELRKNANIDIPVVLPAVEDGFWLVCDGAAGEQHGWRQLLS